MPQNKGINSVHHRRQFATPTGSSGRPAIIKRNRRSERAVKTLQSVSRMSSVDFVLSVALDFDG